MEMDTQKDVRIVVTILCVLAGILFCRDAMAGEWAKVADSTSIVGMSYAVGRLLRACMA